MSQYTLLVGSKSAGRQQLLRDANIPFTLVSQDANEQMCDWTLPLEQAVAAIARYKMEHVILPLPQSDQTTCFVLTADTLTADIYGTLHGKPIDEHDVLENFKLFNANVRVGTAFCLDRKQWINNQWVMQERIEQFVDAHCALHISDREAKEYIKNIPDYLNYSGGMDIQGFGAQFVQSINGSYTTIIGLPMFELRQALEKIGFLYLVH